MEQYRQQGHGGCGPDDIAPAVRAEQVEDEVGDKDDQRAQADQLLALAERTDEAAGATRCRGTWGWWRRRWLSLVHGDFRPPSLIVGCSDLPCAHARYGPNYTP